LREQLLDAWSIEFGILNTLIPVRNKRPEYDAALARAINDCQGAEWLDREPRLRASLLVPFEDGELAAAEIERVAPDRRFVQVLLPARTSEPLGARRYWPLYAAAERHDLPVGIHFGGGSGGHPLSGAGWPSFYFEDHGGMPQTFQAHVISMIFEGIFGRFPNLKIVLIEGGMAWMAPLTWRLDRSWNRLRDEVPHVTELPSLTIRKHLWVTTQPMEEPPVPAHFTQMLNHLGMNDRILFATITRTGTSRSTDQAFPVKMEAALKQDILSRTRDVYTPAVTIEQD
jgi:predicted TIM-barrel fold metal-dependent hydrolase